MVSTFEDFPTKAFTSVAIQEEGSERPSPEKLDRVDDVMAGVHGFAFRFGVGSGEPSLNTYEYGYLLPRGAMMDRHRMEELEQDLADAGVRDPWVRLKALWVDGEKIDQMELVGTPPEEALSGLMEFADDFDEYRDG